VHNVGRDPLCGFSASSIAHMDGYMKYAKWLAYTTVDLERRQYRHSHIPAIMITGHIGHETGTEML
jgi:hypothetical protein